MRPVVTRIRTRFHAFQIEYTSEGTGKVGQMSSLINQAFEIITKEAGKAKAAFLIIDEADSLSATRDGVKVTTNIRLA